MFCSHCGKQISNVSKFCGYCGHSTKVAHGSPSDQPYAQAARPQGCCPPYEHSRGYSSPTPGIPNISPGAGKGVVHTARKIGTYKILPVIAALICILIVLFYNQFLKAGKPEDTIADLEKALNNLDTEAMLECFDQQTQKLYSGSLALTGSFFDLDLEGISDLTTGLGGIMAGTGLTPKFTMNVSNIEYSNNNACMATVNMTVSYEGETESETVQLPMKKIDRKWVISMGALSDFVYN